MNISKKLNVTDNWFTDLCAIRECIEKEAYALSNLAETLDKVASSKVCEDVDRSSENSKNSFLAALTGAMAAGINTSPELIKELNKLSIKYAFNPKINFRPTQFVFTKFALIRNLHLK